MRRFLCNLLVLRATVVASALLVAWPLWHLVPPEPRLMIEGAHHVIWQSADGAALCTVQRSGGDWLGPIRFWNTRAGEQFYSLLTSADKSNVWPAFSPDGRRFAATPGPSRLLFCEWRTGRAWATDFGADWEIYSIAFSPDGDTMAVQAKIGTIALVETASGRILDRVDSDQYAFQEFTAEGRYFVFAKQMDGKSLIGVWNRKTRQLDGNIEGSVVATIPGRGLLASELQPNDAPACIAVWELGPHAPRCRVRFTPKTTSLPGFCLSPNGAVLATFNNMEEEASELEFWDLNTGKLLASAPPVRGGGYGAFSPDGSHFAMSSYFSIGRKRNRTDFSNLTLHEVASGAVAWTRTWSADSHARSPRFNASGRLVQIYVEGHVEFLDAATGRTVAAARFRKEPAGSGVWTTDSVSPTPDRRLLPYREEMRQATFERTWLDRLLESLRLPVRPREAVDWDMVSVLDMETAREIMHLEGIGTINPLLLSDDGLTLVTQHADHIAVWDVPPRPPLRWVLAVPALIIASLWLVGRMVGRWWKRTPSPPAPLPRSGEGS